MLLIKLALRNILGAGLRTWLNVIVLSLSFVVIILTQGIYKGMEDQVSEEQISTEYASGQYWSKEYDPYNMVTLESKYSVIPQEFHSGIKSGEVVAQLYVPVTSYPHGEIIPALLRGINNNQSLLDIPTNKLVPQESDAIPVVIGKRMAKNLNVEIGSTFTLKWRDAFGSYDAKDAIVADIFQTLNPSIDKGQIFMALSDLYPLMGKDNIATIITHNENHTATEFEKWEYHSQYQLLVAIRQMIQMKSGGANVIYFILLGLAAIGIFDTQILSMWRRRKEMGTLMALGMTRFKLVMLFTLEGSIYGVLAALVAAIYGLPIIDALQTNGIPLPDYSDNLASQ